ncbi:MAG: phosphatidylglycerophosphatase A [Bacteroidetes bacterium]|nr:phosphatidylglycerophosphatase A [Bacteroidota bacterium]MCH8523801.1 phosphatidylglycerophosphatase A [Balneolales bacterium]
MISARLKYWTGTGLGSGLLPKAPGTWGSLFSLIPASITLHFLGWPGLVILLAMFLASGFWSAGWFETTHGKDPSIFVMDEWAGQVLPLFIIPLYPEINPILLVTFSFLLFRLFDITKPLGIDSIQNLPGAAGVMLDDILAGLYALGTLFFVIFIYYTFF